MKVTSSTSLHSFWINMAGFVKDIFMLYCEHEAKCKDCELYLNELKLALPREIDMLLLFEKGIRGAITQTVKRHAKASKKYMIDLYKHISSYLNADNLSGWAMIPKLPTHGFCMRKKVDDFTP